MSLTITALPTAPSRSDPTTFSTRADAWVAALATFVTEANALAAEAETHASEADADATTAASDAAISTAAKAVCQAAANYKGPWASQAGAAAVPYAVSHLGKYWQLASNLADVTAKTPGTDAEWLVISGYFTRTNKTQADSPVALVVGDIDGFRTYTNTGATGETTFNLPAGADGCKVHVIVTAAQYMKFVANGSETFRYRTTQSAAGGYIRSNEIGTCFTFEWSGTEWVITNLLGTLKYDA